MVPGPGTCSAGAPGLSTISGLRDRIENMVSMVDQRLFDLAIDHAMKFSGT